MTTVEYKDQSCRLLALTDEVDKRGVTSLRLTNVRLEGSESELTCFGMMFRGHPDLKELYLKNVTLSQDEMNLDQALSCLLVSADHIETVHIENAPITTSSLMTISYCSTLRDLNLPNNRFVDKDAAALADALSSSKTIRKVDLSGNDISAFRPGVPIYAFCPTQKIARRLQIHRAIRLQIHRTIHPIISSSSTENVEEANVSKKRL